jgi:hypothetical protein
MMPDNIAYFQAAYAAVAVLYVAYAISIIVRRRALTRRRDPEAGAR